jgi:adenine C2-methylase RlmN of 23S rRNA A2503 and tRNA A37
VEDARRLVRLVEGTAAKINLIEFNEHEGTGMSGSSAGAIAAFKQVRPTTATVNT